MPLGRLALRQRHLSRLCKFDPPSTSPIRVGSSAQRPASSQASRNDGPPQRAPKDRQSARHVSSQRRTVPELQRRWELFPPLTAAVLLARVERTDAPAKQALDEANLPVIDPVAMPIPVTAGAARSSGEQGMDQIGEFSDIARAMTSTGDTLSPSASSVVAAPRCAPSSSRRDRPRRRAREGIPVEFRHHVPDMRQQGGEKRRPAPSRIPPK